MAKFTTGLSLQFDALWSNIFDKLKENGEVNQLKVLKNIPLFSDLTQRELKIVSHLVYHRNFEPGELMFSTGQPGAAMFIIKEGQVQVFKKSAKDETLLTVLNEGEFLGELALLDNSPRSASARAIKATQTLAIFREDLMGLNDTSPYLAAKILKRLALVIGMRLKATNDLLLDAEDKLYEQQKNLPEIENS